MIHFFGSIFLSEELGEAQRREVEKIFPKSKFSYRFGAREIIEIEAEAESMIDDSLYYLADYLLDNGIQIDKGRVDFSYDGDAQGALIYDGYHDSWLFVDEEEGGAA